MKKYFLLVGLFMASIAAKAQDGNLPINLPQELMLGWHCLPVILLQQAQL